VALGVGTGSTTGRRGACAAHAGPIEDVVLDAPPPAHAGGGDLTAALRRALLRLPPNYAGPVHLHYVQGYSTRDAAELLGITRQTVKMRLYRARAYLRREIHRDQLLRGQPKEPVRRPRR